MPEQEVKRLQENISKCLLKPGPDLVVCDEGHLIKNQTGATNKAITKIHTRRRIILTGTPVQNNLNEYYAMVDWIKPALLGTVREFNNLYANPIKDGQHMDSTPQMIKRMKQRSFILNRKLSKFVQRKEATVLREFLPDKYEYCISVPLTHVQEELYEQYLLKNPVANGHQLLNDYTALRKIWTHPKVLHNARERAMKGELKIGEAKKRSKNQVDEGDDEPDDLLDKIDGNTGVKSDWWKAIVREDDLESLQSSNKLMLLFEILRLCEVKKEKVLIFSAFVAVLNVVEDFMKKINDQESNPNKERYGFDYFRTTWKEGLDYFRLDGSTKREARHQMIQKFNDRSDTRLRCFLISAKAGGQGINLTGANRCIILDTSWNPSSDQQNIFRIYRLGQPNVCFVYRLIALGTMEEKVYSRSVTKQAMSGRVVDKLQIDRHYRLDELSKLYTLTKFDASTRPAPNMPTDDILKYLLHHHPTSAFTYHDHDSLLENKPEQDLNEEEIKEAWQMYEVESKGPVARSALNGNIPLHSNDLLRNDLLNMNYLAASGLDPTTTGLFKQIYQPNFFPNDYLQSFNPFEIAGAFRNNIVPPSSSIASTSNIPTSSGSSSLLRTQLATNMSAVFGPQMFPFSNPTSSIVKSPNIGALVQKRRTSTAKKPPVSSNVQNMMSLQQRFNGKLSRLADDNSTLKNSLANVAILPDGDLPVVRKPPQVKKMPSNSSTFVGHNEPLKNRPASSYLKSTSSLNVLPQQRVAPHAAASPNILSQQRVSPAVTATSGALLHQRASPNVASTSTPPHQRTAPSPQSARTLISTVKSVNNINLTKNVPGTSTGVTGTFAQRPSVVKSNNHLLKTGNNIQQQIIKRQIPSKAGQSIVQVRQPLNLNPQPAIRPSQIEPKQLPKQQMKVNIGQSTFTPEAVRKIHQMTPKQVSNLVGQKSSPISITKLGSPGTSKTDARKQPGQFNPSAITFHKLLPSTLNSSSLPAGTTARIVTQKRTLEVRISILPD